MQMRLLASEDEEILFVYKALKSLKEPIEHMDDQRV